MSSCCKKGLGLCLALCLPSAWAVGDNDTAAAIEFCLSGEFDLGIRLQGMQPEQSERYPTLFCVVTEDESDRVHFSATGKSNPDMSGDFAVSYLSPDVVRLVNRDAPPDIDFLGASVRAEALRYRRMDPRRLIQELREHPEWIRKKDKDDWVAVRYPESPYAVRMRRDGDQLLELRTNADMPLRGRVVVSWTWDWPDDLAPVVSVTLNDAEVFAARASWRTLSETRRRDCRSSGDSERDIPLDAAVAP